MFGSPSTTPSNLRTRPPRRPGAPVVFACLLGGSVATAPAPATATAQPPQQHQHPQQEPHPHPPATPDAPEPTVALRTDLGSGHLPITTYREDAQAYFDQGLRWMHAFNLEEAEASFREATRRDPSCAMCAWGLAFSLGPHINLPALPERTVAAARAVAVAARLAAADPAAATAVERALIAAMERRYSDPAPSTPEAQSALDEAYAEAMRDVSRRFPDRPEVWFLLAESLMDLHPWDLWGADGAPRPWTPEIVAAIERGLALDARHAGLHHLHIHAVEASPIAAAARAERSADFLRQAMPGAAHMVHMPGHIYLRVGRYADAAQANERAIAVDGQYLPQASPNVSFYRMIYAPHNVDFLAAAAAMEGRSATALLAQREVQRHLDPAMLEAMPGYDFILVKPLWTLVHFGRLAEALAEPMPPAAFPYATAMAHAGRGLAYARGGRLPEARVELAKAESAIAQIAAEAYQAYNPARTLASIGRDLLAGEIEVHGGDLDQGLALWRRAASTEDGLRYDEPNDWYFPTRHWIGPALLWLGRPDEAESVFRADLEKFPENGWSLTGLAASLDRQGKAQEAAETRTRAERAWARADLGLERWMAPPERRAAPAVEAGAQ